MEDKKINLIIMTKTTTLNSATNFIIVFFYKNIN